MVFSLKRPAIPFNAEYSVPQARMALREPGRIPGREIRQEEWEATR